MNFNMNIPGLKGVIVHQMEEQEERPELHDSMPQTFHTCPVCGQKMKKHMRLSYAKSEAFKMVLTFNDSFL